MKVLVVGGAGRVGTLILPYLAGRHEICVFDRQPAPGDFVSVQGDVLDADRLRASCAGREALLYLATGPLQDWGSVANAAAHFRANVTCLHVALMIAREAEIRHAVVAGTMSIYDRIIERTINDEDMPPDAMDHYGLSKRLGEEVCRAASEQWHMSVNVLRLSLPKPRSEWEKAGPGGLATEVEDVARAIDMALEKQFGGFEAFNINGDWQEQQIKLTKAKSLLGWEPLARPDEIGRANRTSVTG